MTVCGLATIDLSLLTPWQQVLLFIQMCLGSPVFVSWLIVLIRKHYVAKHYFHLVAQQPPKKRDEPFRRAPPAPERGRTWSSRLTTLFQRTDSLHPVPEDSRENSHEEPRRTKSHEKEKSHKLRPDMIRRVDDAPKLVNPSGLITEGSTEPARQLVFAEHPPPAQPAPRTARSPAQRTQPSRRLSDPGTASKPASLINFPRHETMAPQTNAPFQRTLTVEFAPNSGAFRRRGRPDRAPPPSNGFERTRTIDRSFRSPSTNRGELGIAEERRSIHNGSIAPGISLTTHPTVHTVRQAALPPIHRDFGGFPTPFELLSRLTRKHLPDLHQKLTRTLTLPAAPTLATQRSLNEGKKPPPYLDFDAIVGRNSTFYLLTDEQLEELGGVELQSLNALSWIVPLVSTYPEGSSLCSLSRRGGSIMFALFQVVSSYTNTGMSLVDQSMVPFQKAYPMIIFMVFLILAGNTAFPIFLRLMIWTISQITPRESTFQKPLRFLLDHPRRCFIYLFPSHQTWFLLTVLLGLTLTDWFFFIVLDLDNPSQASIPIGIRCIVGLLQAVAVRAAGFGIVTLSALAPAVKVLYVIMMYISVYPIAMSVRSTNVYEEKSLGVYPEDEEEEDEFNPQGPRSSVWGRYLSMHARKQLAFDMWWIASAIFLVCIVERSNLDNPENFGWFNIFNVVFELVSAYGTVGLSLGTPTTNSSFSGSFRTLSKLIVCAVMIRGRHRGLPVAIDRAVMLKNDYDSENRPQDQPHFTESYVRSPSPLHELSDEEGHEVIHTNSSTEGDTTEDARDKIERTTYEV
ncbi:hypothetical protein ONZ45_g13536 [Pleurotus djamor]|nr:hypothetical protein ONZ45_g13536 [Pleurotus djamor]